MDGEKNGIKALAQAGNKSTFKTIFRCKNLAADLEFTEVKENLFKETNSKKSIQLSNIKRQEAMHLTQKLIQLKENNKRLTNKTLPFNKRIIQTKIIKSNQNKMFKFQPSHLSHIYYLFSCRCLPKQPALKNKLQFKKEVLTTRKSCFRQ